ncbi:MAG: TPM domain-containing protein [Clostridia bacterium]|nr:TPM domain-containing protein [Clostridia bacterium]
MKKTLTALLLGIALLLSLPLPAAAGTLSCTELLCDEADLLTPAEEDYISGRLSSLSGEYAADIVILTLTSLDGYSPEAYANAYYDENAFGQGSERDGVLLLIAMDSRDWHIIANGEASLAITNGDISTIGDSIVPYLSEGDYTAAFAEFADCCEYYIHGHIYGFPFPAGTSLCICLVVGLVLALIVTGVMRAKLRSVRSRNTAGDYIRTDSLAVTTATDLFLYRTVSRRKKPEATSSSSRSSGGGSRSSGGGKF